MACLQELISHKRLVAALGTSKIATDDIQIMICLLSH